MALATQKRLAAQILKSAQKNIWLDPNRLDEVKEAITKADVKSLIKDKAIKAKPISSNSRYRIRKANLQRSKGRRKGPGTRKSGKNARLSRKTEWVNHVRVQRNFLKTLRDKNIIDQTSYRSLYMKSKGGFFRSKRHLKIYMEDHGFIKK